MACNRDIFTFTLYSWRFNMSHTVADGGRLHERRNALCDRIYVVRGRENQKKFMEE
jgi:hypothetical protein